MEELEQLLTEILDATELDSTVADSVGKIRDLVANMLENQQNEVDKSGETIAVETEESNNLEELQKQIADLQATVEESKRVAEKYRNSYMERFFSGKAEKIAKEEEKKEEEPKKPLIKDLFESEE